PLHRRPSGVSFRFQQRVSLPRRRPSPFPHLSLLVPCRVWLVPDRASPVRARLSPAGPFLFRAALFRAWRRGARLRLLSRAPWLRRDSDVTRPEAQLAAPSFVVASPAR